MLLDLAVDRLADLSHPLGQLFLVELVLAEHVEGDLDLGEYFVSQNTLLMPVNLDDLVQLPIAFLQLTALPPQLYVHLVALGESLFQDLTL